LKKDTQPPLFKIIATELKRATKSGSKVILKE